MRKLRFTVKSRVDPGCYCLMKKWNNEKIIWRLEKSKQVFKKIDSRNAHKKEMPKLMLKSNPLAI